MTLTRKLTLAFLLVAVTAAAIVAIAVRATNSTRLNQLIIEQQRANFAVLVTDYYQQNGSLNGLNQYLQTSLPSNQPNQINPPPPEADRRDIFGFVNTNGVVIVPLHPQFPLGTHVSADVIANNTPLKVNGVLIGTIITPPAPPSLTPQEQAFLQRANEALVIAALGAALLALVIGILLARTLTRPLRALTDATEKMAGGELSQQVTVNSKDEIGELADSFNRMSREVAHANQLRKQMTADIAHDLRTPLTVIAGYVESMRDGDLAPTPERLDSIYAEIERLQRLVSDLRLLAVADAGELRLNLAPVNPKDLLERVAASFKLSAEQKGINLIVDADSSLPEIQADESRLDRVLSNLVSNAIRHTPEGGNIHLSAGPATPSSILATRQSDLTPIPSPKGRGGAILISVEDTGEGIPPADLPHIFDRFYRADKSRTDADGASSGLGLAIAKALVEAHGGKIWAESEEGRGTKMIVELPIK